MTNGFQYDHAQWDGATYGGTLPPAHYRVDGVLFRVAAATFAPAELVLEVRARSATQRDTISALESNAGSIATRTRADGTRDALDTAGGANTVTVEFPTSERPPRPESRTYLVESVETERLSADTQALAATCTLVPTSTRTEQEAHLDASDANAWTFSVGAGRVVTDRVRVSAEAGATTEVDVVLTDRQAELVETVTAATAGAVADRIPDGVNRTRDTTPGGRQTVTIDPPDDASDPPLEQGDYVVTEWDVERLSAVRTRMAMTVDRR